MTQTPFERHDPQANIEAVEQVDYTESIEKNQNQLHQQLEKFNADLFQIEQAAAKRQDQALMNLANLSPKLADLAKPALEAHNTRAEMEAADKAQEILKNNPNFYSNTWNVEESESDRIQAGHETIVDDNYSKGLISPDLAMELRDLPGQMDKRVKRALLRERLKAYPGGFLQGASLTWTILDKEGNEVERILSDAKDPYERNQIITHINRAWRRPFSGSDWDQAMVYKYLGEGMERHEAAEDQAYNAEQQQKYKSLVTERRISSVVESLADGGPGLQTYLINNVGKYSWAGPKDSMRLARLQLVEDLKTLAKDERYADIERIKNSVFNDELKWNDGSIATFAEKFPSEFDQLDRVFTLAEKAEKEEIQLKDRNRMNEFESSLIKLRNDKANSTTEDTELTEADLRGIKNQFRKEFPGREIPDWLNNYVTAEDREDGEDQELLKAIFNERGVVYGSDTIGMSYNTQAWAEKHFGKSFIADDGGSVAQQYATLASEANTQIDNMVSEHFMVTTGDMKDNEEIGEARRRAKDSFSKIFWKHYKDPATAGFDDARIKAMNEVRTNLKEGAYALKLEPDNNTNVLKKRNNVYRNTRENPKSYQSKLIEGSNVDIVKLRQIQAGTTTDGIPPIYHYYAHLNPSLDLDAWDVADAQLKLWEKENNLPIKGLGKQPPLKEYVEGLDSPLEKHFLKSRPSYGRTTRVMVMQEDGNFNNPDLVINGAL